MTVKVRVKRLEAARRPRPEGGFVVGVQGIDMPEDRRIDYRDCIADLAPSPDDLVRVGDQVMTLAQWEALEGHKILVTIREEEVTNE
jgi:hypothetical protein